MTELVLLVPLAAAAAAAMLAGYAWARRGRHRAHGAVAQLACAVLVWAACEVLWNATRDPDTALVLVRLAAFGWVPVGPLLLRIFLATGPPSPWERAFGPLLGVALAFAVLDVATPWLHPAVEPAPWGWVYHTGPLFPVCLLFVLGCIGMGLVPAVRQLRQRGSPAERRQLGLYLAGWLVPTGVGTLTDGVLPMLGIAAPPLGTASFVVTAGLVVWTAQRFGHSLLAPHAFTEEILDTLRDGVVLLHPDGRVRHANATFASLTAEPPEALCDRPVGTWLTGFSPPPAPERRDRETEVVSADGARIPVTVTSRVLRDREAHPLGLVLGIRDLREVVGLRRRVVTSGRLAAVGGLAAGIAHEINNPLAYLRANLGGVRTLLEELADKPDLAPAPEALEDGRERIEESIEGADRIAAVVRDLRTLSGPSDRTRELVDVNALLAAALRVLQPHLRFGARVEQRLADVPRVAGSSAELQHVFLAVLLNAGRALGEDGTVEIVSTAEDDQVVVQIRDDGCGIPPELQERVFDPFFTVGDSAEGGGLGLAVAWQVVRQHGGRIGLESAPGRGTCVAIRLPAA